MNLVVMLGRLTRDFQIHYVGEARRLVARGALAVNYRYKTGQGETKTEECFIDLECWGNLGENITRMLGKGDPVLVKGRLRLSRWEDASGAKHSRHTILVESFENVKLNDDTAPTLQDPT